MRRLRRAPLCAWLALAVAGCFSPSSTLQAQGNAGGNAAGGAAGGHHGASGGNGATTHAGTSAGSSGGATSAGSNGGSSGGSTGAATTQPTQGGSSGGGTGGTGGGGCSAIAGNEGSGIFDCAAPNLVETPPAACPGGPYFASTVQDLSTCGGVCGATVELLDPNGAPIAGLEQFADATTSIVDMCLPAGDLVYSPSVQAAGYPPFYYGEIHGQLSQPQAGLGMVSLETAGAFGALFSGYTDTTATLVVYTYSFSDCANSNAGWNVSLALPDGGPWPDGGYIAYYSETGTGYPSSQLTATTDYGTAVLVAIDPNVSPVASVVFTNPSPGNCPSLNDSMGFTGHIRLAAGAFSVQVLFLP